jgi:hypothetical protein
LYKDLLITSKRFYEEYKENDLISEDERIDDITARRIIEEKIIQPKSFGPPDLIPIMTIERNNEEIASVFSPVYRLAPPSTKTSSNLLTLGGNQKYLMRLFLLFKLRS